MDSRRPVPLPFISHFFTDGPQSDWKCCPGCTLMVREVPPKRSVRVDHRAPG